VPSFACDRAADASRALDLAQRDNPRFLAGGTGLPDLVNAAAEHAARLIDLNRAGLAAIAPAPGGGVSLGALARHRDTANHALARQRCPLLKRL
jgi:xanthine dehydrogenase YagS FAD-binding subunit